MSKREIENRGISFNELTTGNIIQIRDNYVFKLYYVIRKGQTIICVPIDLNNRKEFNVYNIHLPKIAILFDKKGDAIAYSELEINKIEEGE